LQQILHFIAVALRFLLWPVARLSYVVFPTNELDGVSSHSSALATQQFISLVTKSSHTDSDATPLWNTVGFSHAQQQAITKEQLLLVYLYSPLQNESCNNGASSSFSSTRLWSHPEMLDLLRHVTATGMSIHTGPGVQLAQRLQVAAYPALILLEPPPQSTTTTTTTQGTDSNRSRQTWKMALSVQGSTLMHCDTNTLIRYCQQALHQHQSSILEVQQRRQEQWEAQLLRQQQDAEYQESLRQDQERERQAQLKQEEAERAAQQAAQAALEEAQQAQQALEAAKNTVREPPTSGGTMVRFVLPSGMKVNRRFYNDDTMGVLISYLKLYFHENNIDIQRVALSTNFPKKTYNDESITLEDAGLTPQAVLMVQDLDA
jgi:hypothetical protein